MSPARCAGGAFRSVGGAIVTRAGRPLRSPPLDLFRFYGREMVAQSRAGRTHAARHCAEMALDLACAIAAADDWRRAGDGSANQDPALSAVRALAAEARALAAG